MTFNKMRFPIVWITLALCVVLCAIEAQCGPVDSSNNKDIRLASKDNLRTARQEENDVSGQEDGDEEGDGGSEDNDDDGEGGGDESGGDDGDDDEDEDEERSLKRFVREASQKPLLIEEQPDEDSVIPITELPTIDDVTTKKPSVLHLLSTALDKAIAATTKLPTQQMASDAASVFLLLGQVFSEAIDKVIGDDGPEEGATEIPLTNTPDDSSKPQIIDDGHGQTVKVEKQPEINSSHSGVVRFS